MSIKDHRPALIELLRIQLKGGHDSIKLEIIEKLTELEVYSPHLLTKFIKDVEGQSFIYPEYRVRGMIAIALNKYLDEQFILSNLEKITQNSSIYQLQTGNVADALFRLGLIKNQFSQFFFKLKFESLTLVDKIHVLSYLFLIENNNEANELFKKIIITVENELDDKNDKNLQNYEIMQIVLLSEYSKKIGSQDHEILKKIIEQQKYSEAFAKLFSHSSKAKQNFLKFLSQLFTAMNVEHKISTEIDGLTVDILLPEEKMIVTLLTPKEFTQQKNQLIGISKAKLKVLSSINGFKVNQLKIQNFIRCGKKLSDKIYYLNTIGIKTKTNEVNFTKITGGLNEQEIENELMGEKSI